MLCEQNKVAGCDHQKCKLRTVEGAASHVLVFWNICEKVEASMPDLIFKSCTDSKNLCPRRDPDNTHHSSRSGPENLFNLYLTRPRGQWGTGMCVRKLPKYWEVLQESLIQSIRLNAIEKEHLNFQSAH